MLEDEETELDTPQLAPALLTYPLLTRVRHCGRGIGMSWLPARPVVRTRIAFMLYREDRHEGLGGRAAMIATKGGRDVSTIVHGWAVDWLL